MGLQNKDIFLINRYDSTDSEWKSYRINYSDLRDQLNDEITIDLNEIGYTTDEADLYKQDDAADDNVARTRFSSRGGVNYNALTHLVFHPGVTNVLNVLEGDRFLVRNLTQGTEANFEAEANAVITGAAGQEVAVVQVKLLDATNTGAFAQNDNCSFRSLQPESGGSINIGICPPGMKEDLPSNPGLCVVDPDYGEIENGTLWYNPMNGITYIWYEHVGTSDGQWVDVRPAGSTGGSGGGGIDIDGLFSKFVQIAGDNMTGDLTLGTDKVAISASGGTGAFAGNVSASNASNVGQTVIHKDGAVNITRVTSNTNKAFTLTSSGSEKVNILANGKATFTAASNQYVINDPTGVVSSRSSNNSTSRFQGLKSDNTVTFNVDGNGKLTAKTYNLESLNFLP